jgi:1-deoxy-D-xylulose 5-phosphate reductoisomerase
VAAFLDGKIPWIAIPDVLEAALDLHDGNDLVDADAVEEVDRAARQVAGTVVERKAARG